MDIKKLFILLIVCIFTLSGCLQEYKVKTAETKNFVRDMKQSYEVIKNISMKSSAPRFLIDYDLKRDISEEIQQELFLKTLDFIFYKENLKELESFRNRRMPEIYIRFNTLDEMIEYLSLYEHEQEYLGFYEEESLEYTIENYNYWTITKNNSDNIISKIVVNKSKDGYRIEKFIEEENE